MPGFVHLHVHSSYSLLEGALTIARLAELAKADRQPALALTDTDNMFGALEFSDKMAGGGHPADHRLRARARFLRSRQRCTDRHGSDAGAPAHRSPGRARERLPQPDAPQLARVSRNRAERAAAPQAGLARRRERRLDRVDRRPRRAARRRPARRVRTSWRTGAARRSCGSSAIGSTSNCSGTARPRNAPRSPRSSSSPMHAGSRSLPATNRCLRAGKITRLMMR